MTNEQILFFLLPLVVSLLVAVLTPVVTARMTTARVAKMWKLERRQATLDSLKQHMHNYVQGVYVAASVVQAAPIVSEEGLKTELSTRLVEALAEAIRALGSVPATVEAIGDKRLQDATDNFDDIHMNLLKGEAEEAVTSLTKGAGALLKRCDELLEEADKAWWKRFFRQ